MGNVIVVVCKNSFSVWGCTYVLHRVPERAELWARCQQFIERASGDDFPLLKHADAVEEREEV